MSDIVERLRQPWPPSNSEDPLMTEAADEIERLRSFEAANKMNSAQVAAQRLVVENQNAEIERLRAALREIIADSFSVYAIEVARAALEERT